ncbi:MAG TPA: hypothetical protein VEV16_01265 [Daejeonella sp.]|nr:hypothetical protein [Daejeonella sp.]
MKKLILALVAIAAISVGFGQKEEVAAPKIKNDIGRTVTTKDLSAFD